jgi:hypothetical protein
MIDLLFKSFLSGIITLLPVALLVAIPILYALKKKSPTTPGQMILVVFELALLVGSVVSAIGLTTVSLIVLLDKIWK